MFVKLAVLACVAVASAQHWAGAPQAAQYPAGVSAHDCPNYPHCGAPAAAPAWNGGHNQWNGGNNGQWNNGGAHDGSWNGNNPAESGSYTGDGDYHGEGLQEAGAFGDVSQNWNDNNGHGQWNGDNNGQWNNGGHQQWNDGNNGQWNGGNNGQWNNGGHQQWNGAQAGAWNGGHQAAPAALPAGVDAHSCPNYPYCH